MASLLSAREQRATASEKSYPTQRVGWPKPTAWGVLVLAVCLSGCRFAGRQGPVPKELARSRELSRQGVAAMEAGRWDEANDLLAKAVKACPEDCDARRHYAEVLWRRGEQDKAIAELGRAVGGPGVDATAHVRLAEMYLARGQLAAAATQIDAALDLEPRLAVGWAMRGRLLRAAGRRREAVADYHRALAYAPNEPAFLLETAEVYQELNQPRKALSLLHSLADTYGPGEEPPEVAYRQGMALASLGRHDEALGHFTEALARGGPSAELLYRLAETHWRLGHANEATAVAQQALALAPDHRASLRLLDQLSLAGRPAGPAR